MKDYIELMKPRITLLVIVTCYLGYYLGLRHGSNELFMMEQETIILFFHLVLGTLLTSSGSAVLNQYKERDLDLLMDRTKNRPLPLKKIKPINALILGLIFSISGSLYLYFFINPLTALIAALTIISYVMIYTPLKTKTKWNTIIGAFPGALPPVGGWTAATGNIEAPAIILFFILFFWQMPHFLSLAIIYKDDYAKAGFKMFPSVSNNLDSTYFQIIFFTIALIISTISVFFINNAGVVYLIGAVLLGIVFLVYSSIILFDKSDRRIRKLFIFSIIYLPLLMLLIMLDPKV